MKNLPPDFIFSQSSLQDYVDCPRRFQLKYLLGQRWPAPEVDDLLAFERRMEQGERFHHLVHQHLVGIPPELLLKRLADADVRRWFETYLRAGLDDLPAQRRPEVTLTVPLGEYALTAKFDLLAIAPGARALIVDWKTGGRIPRPEALATRLQTIVYRYVLAKGGDHLNGGIPIATEHIEMVYWYADHDGATRRFGYDGQQLQAAEVYLLKLIEAINTRRDFPLTPDDHRCRYCVYRSLCDRGTSAGALADWDEADVTGDLGGFSLDLDQIGEIAF
jgi:predicted RecB family nuclease